jgi:hypothetical protein
MTSRAAGLAIVLSVAALPACGPAPAPADTPELRRDEAAAIERGVRAFMAAVASDITRIGPAAWRLHFSDSPAFFMASEGQLAFTDIASANHTIDELTRTVKHIELRWGTPVRVDPLAPALAAVGAPYEEVRVDTADHRVDEKGYFTAVAERRANRWQFRDAHWSVVAPPGAPH